MSFKIVYCLLNHCLVALVEWVKYIVVIEDLVWFLLMLDFSCAQFTEFFNSLGYVRPLIYLLLLIVFCLAFRISSILIKCLSVIFKVYDSDCNGKVTFNDMIEVLQELAGPFMSDQQREVLLMWTDLLF